MLICIDQNVQPTFQSNEFTELVKLMKERQSDVMS